MASNTEDPDHGRIGGIPDNDFVVFQNPASPDPWREMTGGAIGGMILADPLDPLVAGQTVGIIGPFSSSRLTGRSHNKDKQEKEPCKQRFRKPL